MKQIFVKFKKPRTVREFLMEFFSVHEYDNKEYYTSLKSVTTYRDKECKKYQCGKDKYRSFEEFFKVVKTAYPSITKKKLVEYLATTLIKRKNYRGVNVYYAFYPSSCCDIERVTCLFFSVSEGDNLIWNDKEKAYVWEYYWNTITKYNSERSWREWAEIIDIDSKTKFINLKRTIVEWRK